MTFDNWDQLTWWKSGEWQKAQEDLNELRERGIQVTPSREEIFRALHICPFIETRVCILGQDPYPNPAHATGVAFSIPSTCRTFPPTLCNILQEYSDVHGDLKYPYPKTGCLDVWSSRGVLLWNSYPTLPRIEEFSWLTKEILERLSDMSGIVFVSLGQVALQFINLHVDMNKNITLHYSHPSPLGWKKGITPFHGGRMFSTINDKLCSLNEDPIDWRLP